MPCSFTDSGVALWKYHIGTSSGSAGEVHVSSVLVNRCVAEQPKRVELLTRHAARMNMFMTLTLQRAEEQNVHQRKRAARNQVGGRSQRAGIRPPPRKTGIRKAGTHVEDNTPFLYSHCAVPSMIMWSCIPQAFTDIRRKNACSRSCHNRCRIQRETSGPSKMPTNEVRHTA